MHDTNLLEDQPIAWMPTPDVIERAQLTRFMKQVGVSTWDELYAFSIRDVEKFTEEVLKFLDIKFDPPYERLMDVSEGLEFPKWVGRSADTPVRMSVASTRTNADDPDASIGKDSLAGGTGDADKSVRAPSAGLNITTMCLDRWQTDEMKDQPAVIWEGEETDVHRISYAQLTWAVETMSSWLRTNGLGKGDAVGIHLPMMPATVVMLLAINRIGAIAVPVFSGYGVEAIASRLNAVSAKGLMTCDGFPRRGKPFNAVEVAREAVAHCPSIQTVYIFPRLSKTHFDSPFTNQYIDFGNVHVWHDEQLSEIDTWDRKVDALLASTDPEPTSAEDPLIILYTSGTTGKPKGIAHTHASFPIKAAQDMAFGTDVGKGTRISWYTDIGWMMGPWLIYGALINGATICIYDGAPDYPTPDRMWEFCAKHKVEVLGISPTLVRSLAAVEERSGDTPVPMSVASTRTSGDNLETFIGAGSLAGGTGDGEGSGDTPVPMSVASTRTSADNLEASIGQESFAGGTGDGDKSVPTPTKAPFERHDLSSLRIFASTGEPWNPAPWWWLFEKVGNGRLPIINYSGGTEIAGGILMGNPLLAIKPCSFPAPCPGMDVDILDEDGNPVEPGKVGELVIKQPWIGMARGFWQEKERYLETYWRRFKNIWVHGDWAMRDKDGDWFILGRSDDTLKVAGKRVGPAEVESLLVAHPLVTEAAVIGVPDEVKGTAMVAFCVLGSADTHVRMSVASMRTGAEHPQTSMGDDGFAGGTGDADKSVRAPLEAELKSLVAKDMGKPLAPSLIHFVLALPKTRNAKVMRRVIRSAYLGEDPGDLSALEDPKAVEEIDKARRK